MPRTTTTGELADLATAARREPFRLWIANSVGTLVEFTSKAKAISVRAHIDTSAVTASIELARESSSGSDAPLMNSPATVDVGRRVKVDVDVVDHAGTPSYKVLFDGTIHEPAWGGSGNTISLGARDGWGDLEDTWIESESTYGSVGGTAIATVMQSILTDNGTGVTLLVNGSPSTVIYEYTQRRMSVGAALRALADVNGWDLRYRWHDGSADFRLTFEEPDRTATIPDHTFTTADYRDLATVRRSSAGVRNVCEVQYTASGASVTSTDTTSTGEHGRRFMFVDASQDPQILTTGVAGSLSDAIIGDLAQPLLDQTVDCRLWWPVELGDLYRFPSNSVHYSSAQDGAVVGYTHQLRAGTPGRTLMELRGTPSGGTRRWTKKAGITATVKEITEGPQAIPPSSDTVLPRVDMKPEQIGASGVITLTLIDPDGYIDALAYDPFTGGGDFDFSLSPTGWANYDPTATTLTDSVALAEDHASFLAYAYRYNLTGTGGGTWVRRLVTFDRNKIPRFTGGLGQIGASVWLSYSGDEDTGSIRWALSTTGMPSTGSVAAGTVVAGRQSDGVEIKTDLDYSETAYVRARAYTTSGGGGTSSLTDYTERVERPPADGSRVPSFRFSTTVTGSTASLSMVLIDPDGLVDGTSFETAVGGQAYDFTGSPTGWSGYDNLAPYNLAATAALVGGHITRIAAGIRFDVGSGDEWDTIDVPFDLNTVPSFAASLNRVNTSLYLSVIGDDDLGAIRYATSTTGTPSTGAVAAGTVVAGQASETLLTSSLAATATLYARVRGFELASGGGAESSEDWTGRDGDPVPDGSIGTAKIQDAAVAAAKVVRQSQFFSCSVVFSSGSYSNLAWGSGTIYFSDGTTGSISSSSISLTAGGAPRYVYYDGTTALKNSTSLTAVLADESYVLLCTAWASDSNHDDCGYVPAFGAMGAGKVSITARQISAGSISTDKLQANSVTAAKITSINLSTMQAEVGTLSELNDDAGIIISGELRNAAGTTFIDLDATGTGTFIKCGTDIVMQANGTAVFDGEVSSSSFTAGTAAFNSASFDSITMATGATSMGVIGSWATGASKGVSISPTTGLDLLVGGAIGQSIRVPGTSSFRDDVTVTGGTLDVSGVFTTESDAFIGGATGDSVGFYGSGGSTKPTVTGSRGGNAALQSLLVALAGQGLINNSTT